MIAAGALAAGVAVMAATAALRGESVIERRLARLLPQVGPRSRWRPVSDRDLAQSEIRVTQADIAVAKVLGLVAGVALGGACGAALGAGAFGAIAVGYAGFVLPTLAVERRAATLRRGADRPIALLLDRLDALSRAGRPVETTLAMLARIPTGSTLLDRTLRRAADAYALGAPLFRSLALHAATEGLEALAKLATDLERSRDLGQGSVAVVREARDAVRAARRTRTLEAAAKVEGKLMLTLVLCYLPALLLLVVVPLFLTLLDGLFG